MTTYDPSPSIEGMSDALLDARDEAYERWLDADEDDPGGVAWDVMSDEAMTAQFTPDDWRVLYDLGAWRIRNTPDATAEMRATVDNDPRFVTPLVGLMVLMGDRFDSDHPETLDAIRAQTAAQLAKAERLEALADTPVSDAFVDVLDEAHLRWLEAQADLRAVWAVLAEDAYGGRLIDSDWERLMVIGQGALRDSPELAAAYPDGFERAPEFGTAVTGLHFLVESRYEDSDPDLRETHKAAAEAKRRLTDAQGPPRSRGFFDGWTTRLWRRKQIASGVRINLSKSGPSLTLGPKGGHVTYGPKGRTETIGLPGTGGYLQRRKPKP